MQNTEYYTQRESSRDKNYINNNAPNRVVVILTNKCNLKCYFCFLFKQAFVNKFVRPKLLVV